MAKKKDNNEEKLNEELQDEGSAEAKTELDRAAIAEEYLRLAQEAPARQVETPGASPAEGEPQTLGEAIGAAEDLTDMQFAMAKLFPVNVEQNATMIARVDPNVFIPLLHLLSVNEIMRSDPKRPIDVNFVYMRNYVRLSIGLDGMGRIDTAELLGAAREEKRAERLMRGGGL